MMGDHSSEGQGYEDWVEKADALLLTTKYSDASEAYTRALSLLSTTDDNAGDSLTRSEILAKRSKAYIATSSHYRTRSAMASEIDPIFGKDPQQLSKDAVRDAQTVLANIKGHNGDKVQELRRDALCLLGDAECQMEQYEVAVSHYKAVLDTNKHDERALFGVFKVERLLNRSAGGDASDDMDVSSGRELVVDADKKTNARDDLDCRICSNLLYEPVTTRCGHSFCKSCLMRAIDHSPKCPWCRSTLLANPDGYPVSIVLKNLLKVLYPDEYEARGADNVYDNLRADATARLPVFVLDDVLPSNKMELHIFEPRYRLMIRRVMESSAQMVFTRSDRMRESEDGQDSDEQYGGCVRVTECQTLPDGRYLLTVECVSRVVFGELESEDGYLVANTKMHKDSDVVFKTESSEQQEGATEEDGDDSPANTEGELTQEEFQAVRDSVLSLAHTWRQSLQATARQSDANPLLFGRRNQAQMARTLLEMVGPAPRDDDLEAMSFWVLALVAKVAPKIKRDGEEVAWVYDALKMQDTVRRWQLAAEVYKFMDQ